MTAARIVNRFKKEGRYAEAWARFSVVINEKLADGKITHTQAKLLAWQQVDSEFPALTKKEIAELAATRAAEKAASKTAAETVLAERSEVSIPPLADILLAAGDGDIDADLAWAYKHIASDVKQSDAPNGSAWHLRELGRDEKTRAKFFDACHKALSKKAGAESEAKMRDDRARQFKLLTALRDEFETAGCYAASSKST